MAKQRRGYRIDMVNGPLAGKILFFALPLMASSLLQLLFNAADIVVVGRFVGKEALAAVGSNGSLVNLLVNLFMGFSVGANVVVAQDLGGGREEDVRKSVHTAITLSLLSGLALTLIGATLARQLLELISSPEDVIDLATVYLRIYFFGMPANMLYNFGAAILRSQGDTQRPLYYLTIAGVVNVLLNLFFVVVLQISVAGVALATIISQYISAGLVLLCMLHEPGALHLDLRSLGIDKDVVRRICRVGLPAGFQGIVFSLSNVVIQGSINSFNSTAIVAGSSAASNIEGFVYVCPSSFYQAALTFTSQNYGAGKCGRVDRILLLTQIYGMTSAAVLGLLAYGFGAPLASIYAPGEPEVIEWAGVLGGAHGGVHAGGLRDTASVDRHGLPDAPVPYAPGAVPVLPHQLAHHRGHPFHRLPSGAQAGLRPGGGAPGGTGRIKKYETGEHVAPRLFMQAGPFAGPRRYSGY